MPTIGLPDSVIKGTQFGDIRKAESRPEKSIGEVANKIAGSTKNEKDGLYVEGKNHNKMGKDEFLKLLAHQMRHQDPFNPMDQNKLAADLAQYSQLEQLTNMNSSLEGLKQNAPAESKFYAASFLGKKVTTGGTTVQLTKEKTSGDLSFTLSGNAKNAIIRVYDQKQQMIQQINKDGLHKGSHTVTWDGRSLDETWAGAGTYHVEVLAFDENNQPIEAKTQQTGTVTGVQFENNETVFIVDGSKKVFLRDVQSFGVEPQTTATPQVRTSPTASALMAKEAYEQTQGNNEY